MFSRLSQNQRQSARKAAGTQSSKSHPRAVIVSERDRLLYLQQTIGNRAVQRLIAASPGLPMLIQRDGLDDGFKSNAHKVLTKELLKSYVTSSDWQVSVMQEYRTEVKQQLEFGVVISIRKRSAPRGTQPMYTHFHVHMNKKTGDLSAHFKAGRGKGASQGFDLNADSDTKLLVDTLLNKANESSWTQFGS